MNEKLPIQPSPAHLILLEVRHIRELLEVIEAQARSLIPEEKHDG